MSDSYPELIAVALDATDARQLAEFYRRLLGYTYRAGDQPPAGEVPPETTDPDWLVLLDRDGVPRLAVQRVDRLVRPTWPDPEVGQQLHLDLRVSSADRLADQRQRAVALGAEVLEDRSDDPTEALIVFADPAGHPFCILVSPPVG